MLSVALGLTAGFTWRRRGRGRTLMAGVLIIEGVLVVQALLGLVLVIMGHRPTSPLHWLYGALLLIPLPAALAYASRPDRRAPALVGAAAMVLLFVFRAFATG